MPTRIAKTAQLGKQTLLEAGSGIGVHSVQKGSGVEGNVFKP